MTNFNLAHDRWLDPPDDNDPTCDGGCGDTLERDLWTREWVCPNRFCPTKFQGVEKEMAEALVEYMDKAHEYMDKAYYYQERYHYMKLTAEELKQNVEKLQNNK
jgi:hypothetical protein